MEITLVSPQSLRIKGKQSTVMINPHESSSSTTVIVFRQDTSKLKLKADDIVIEGPGDYEIGGVKITGIRYDAAVAFSFIVDDVNILLIDTASVAKYHQKMRDYDIVILDVLGEEGVSAAVNLAGSALLYYGDKAREVVKDSVATSNKFVTTKDKLTDEVQQVVLV